MSHIKRSLASSGLVLLCVCAVVAGVQRRTRVDQGERPNIGQNGPGTASASNGNWVASTATVPQISETNYFQAVSELLKDKFVDPVTDDKKLVGGAIRGMIASLNDPDSVYMDADEFTAFLNARVGKYEGIGAELILQLSAADKAEVAKLRAGTADAASTVSIPRLIVALVVPDGPADRAGVKVGDWVDSVDGKWVVNSDPLRKLRNLQIQVQKGKAKPADLNNLRQELRAKSKVSMLPGRAKDRLMIGKEGTLSVKWVRAASIRTTQLTKAPSELSDTLDGNATAAIRLLFVPGEAAKLKRVVAGRSSVTIDLRGHVAGDFNSMKECLSVLAPAGTYGYVTREQGATAAPLTLAAGNPKPPRVTLLVDSGTQGVAEVFALALSSKGGANLSGTAMADNRTICEVVALPDGTGYTLATGKYVTAKPATKPKSKKLATTGPPDRDAPEAVDRGVVCDGAEVRGESARRAA